MTHSAILMESAMETPTKGEAVKSYESRSELALRSAVDPAVEPCSNPSNAQGHTSSHAEKHSKNELEAVQQQAEPNDQNSKPKRSKQTSVRGQRAGQLQSNDVSDSQILQETPPPSKGSANVAMSISPPDFIVRRNELFDKLQCQRHAEILEKEKPEISVVLDLGLDNQGRPRATMPVAAKAWESTPGSFLRHVDREVSSDVVIAKVDGKELWDLDRPLEYGCRVSYVSFSSAEGRKIFWHSSAHVLGEACECQFNCLLSHGPPVEQGFFYDMAINGG